MKNAKFWLNLMGVWCVLGFGCVGVARAQQGKPDSDRDGLSDDWERGVGRYEIVQAPPKGALPGPSLS